MTFGDKLYKLRKENGLSQEALAEKLNTSRQAVSKWENGQGYPEMDKMVTLGNLFGVSLDYLLKDSAEPAPDREEGYYVSRETGEGYLQFADKTSKRMALGFLLIALAFIPYFVFDRNPALYLVPTILLAVLGFGTSLSSTMLEEERYRTMKKEPLLLDEKYLQELNARYDQLKKKYGLASTAGGGLFAAGILAFGIERRFMDSPFLEPYYPYCIGLIGLGVYIMTRSSGVLEAYQLLARNETYANRFGFKLRRKLWKKFDEL